MSKSLTIDDLRTLTPAVFAPEPAPDVSDIYEFMPTLPLIEQLLAQGWEIRSAHQNRATKAGALYAAHRIVSTVPCLSAAPTSLCRVFIVTVG